MSGLEIVENRPTLPTHPARLRRVRASRGVPFEPGTLPASIRRPSPGPHHPSRPAQPLKITSSATGFDPGFRPSSASRARIEPDSPAGRAWQCRAFTWASNGTHPTRFRRRVRAPRSVQGGFLPKPEPPRDPSHTAAPGAPVRDPAGVVVVSTSGRVDLANGTPPSPLAQPWSPGWPLNGTRFSPIPTQHGDEMKCSRSHTHIAIDKKNAIRLVGIVSARSRRVDHHGGGFRRRC